MISSPRGARFLAEWALKVVRELIAEERPEEEVRTRLLEEEEGLLVLQGVGEEWISRTLYQVTDYEPTPMLMGELSSVVTKAEYFEDFGLLLRDQGVAADVVEEMMKNGWVRMGWEHQLYVHPLEGYAMDQHIMQIYEPGERRGESIKVGWCPYSIAAVVELLKGEERREAIGFFAKNRPQNFARMLQKPETRPELDLEERALLLEHPDTTVRLATITALGGSGVAGGRVRGGE